MFFTANKKLQTFFFSATLTILLVLFPNKSNIPKEIMVPILVAGLTKYILGDWDNKFQWSVSDIFYWLSILLISYTTILVVDLFQHHNT